MGRLVIGPVSEGVDGDVTFLRGMTRDFFKRLGYRQDEMAKLKRSVKNGTILNKTSLKCNNVSPSLLCPRVGHTC